MGYYSGWDSRIHVADHVTEPSRTTAPFFKEGHPLHGTEWQGSIVWGAKRDEGTSFLGMTVANGDDLEHREIGSVATIAKFWSGLNLWTVKEVKYDEWYVASRGGEVQPVKRVIALYAINRFKPQGSPYVEWGYKPMGEESGPNQVTCPLKFLDMVPDPGGFATGWREKVRRYWASRKMTRKIALGDVYKMTGLGAGVTTLEITSLKPLRARANTGVIYRVSRPLLARRGTYTEREKQLVHLT